MRKVVAGLLLIGTLVNPVLHASAESKDSQTSTVSISFVEPEDPKLLEEFRKEQEEYEKNRIKGFHITIVNAPGSPERIFRPIY